MGQKGSREKTNVCRLSFGGGVVVVVVVAFAL
jgi:hypothetical protein